MPSVVSSLSTRCLSVDESLMPSSSSAIIWVLDDLTGAAMNCAGSCTVAVSNAIMRTVITVHLPEAFERNGSR
jgi:hypothetical protein